MIKCRSCKAWWCLVSFMYNSPCFFLSVRVLGSTKLTHKWHILQCIEFRACLKVYCWIWADVATWMSRNITEKVTLRRWMINDSTYTKFCLRVSFTCVHFPFNLFIFVTVQCLCLTTVAGTSLDAAPVPKLSCDVAVGGRNLSVSW